MQGVFTPGGLPTMMCRRSFLQVVLGLTSAGLGVACGRTAGAPATATPVPIVTAAPAPTSLVNSPPGVANASQVRQYAGQQIAVATLSEATRQFADMDDAIAARFTADSGVKAQVVRHSFNPSNALNLYQGL